MFKILLLVLTVALVVTFSKGDSHVETNEKEALIVAKVDNSNSSSSYSYRPIKANATKAEDTFKCSRYGPFSVDNCSDFTARFTYKLNSVSDQKIIERLRLLSTSGSVLHATSKASFDYVTGKQRTVSFTVPMKDYWTSNGLTLKFEIVNASSYTILKAHTATFYPVLNGTVSIGTLRRKIYTSRSFGFKGDGTNMVETTESFDFTNIGSYVNVDNYYCLDLDNNYFYYLDSYSLSCTSVELRIKDYDNLFPYLTHKSNSDVIVPLTLHKRGTAVTFKLKNSYYVNKKTLQISDVYRQGFALTNRFYLPINGKRTFNNKWLYIDIKELGISKISTSVSLKFNVDRNFVGVCSDGDYCVTGGSR